MEGFKKKTVGIGLGHLLGCQLPCIFRIFRSQIVDRHSHQLFPIIAVGVCGRVGFENASGVAIHEQDDVPAVPGQ